MNDFLKFITDIGKELAPQLLNKILELVFSPKKPGSPLEIANELFAVILSSDASVEARKNAQRFLHEQGIAEKIFKHHEGIGQ